MAFVSYIEYLVYLGIIFGSGVLVGYFWNRATGGSKDV